MHTMCVANSEIVHVLQFYGTDMATERRGLLHCLECRGGRFCMRGR